MRVTKVIKEYVQSEMDAKFNPKIDAIGADYKREKEELDKRLDELREETERKAHEIAKSLGFDYRPTWSGRQRCCVSINSGDFENKAKDDAISAACSKLYDQKRRAVQSILLNLELGATTKAELGDAIAAVEIEM